MSVRFQKDHLHDYLNDYTDISPKAPHYGAALLCVACERDHINNVRNPVVLYYESYMTLGEEGKA